MTSHVYPASADPSRVKVMLGIKVSVADLNGWPADRAAAFLHGIATVLAVAQRETAPAVGVRVEGTDD